MCDSSQSRKPEWTVQPEGSSANWRVFFPSPQTKFLPESSADFCFFQISALGSASSLQLGFVSEFSEQLSLLPSEGDSLFSCLLCQGEISESGQFQGNPEVIVVPYLPT